MKCQFCGKEIANDASFCTFCGKKQEKKVEAPKQEATDICVKCGTKLKADAKFCVVCGTKVEPQTKKVEVSQPKAVEKPQPKQEVVSQKPQPKQEVASQQPQPKQETVSQPEEKKKGNTGAIVVIIILVIVLLALIGVGVGIAIKSFGGFPASDEVVSVEDDEDEEDGEEDSQDSEDTESSQEESSQEESDSTESAKEEDESDDEDVDLDLNDEDYATLVGTIKNSSGGLVIKFAAGISVKDTDDNIIDDVKTAAIDDSELPDGMLEWLTLSEEITAKGEVYWKNETLYIVVEEMTNADGEDMFELYEEQGELSDEYILPNSDTVRLTEDDIEDLTLRELNYAKNEIYARHGRKFDSKELRDYFNSKSWYDGTIDPDDFSDNLLSQIERDNVNLLKEAEFAINSKGYQLDQ